MKKALWNLFISAVNVGLILLTFYQIVRAGLSENQGNFQMATYHIANAILCWVLVSTRPIYNKLQKQ